MEYVNKHAFRRIAVTTEEEKKPEFQKLSIWEIFGKAVGAVLLLAAGLVSARVRNRFL